MTDDIVVELRDAEQRDSDPWDVTLYTRAADEIERLRAVLDAVADLHESTSVDDPRCASCGDWPCQTHLIICDECKEARRG